MMEAMSLALVALARPTFDIDWAAQLTAEVRARLEAAGFLLVGPQELLTTPSEATRVAHELAGEPFDLLVALQATFSDATMVSALAETLDAPLLLWGLPEGHGEGGRLRLNSLCGINLAAYALTRAGHRYQYVYAVPGDLAAVERIRTLVSACRVRRLLRQARIGLLGTHPDGFDPCDFDGDELRALLGVEVTSPQEEGLNAVAARCWPEFFTDLGCAACGAMSLLTDDQVPCGCEADVAGTVTQLMLQWLSGESAFSTDLVTVDQRDNTAVVWHCGSAPLSMADPAVEPRGQVHPNRQIPLVMEFPLKPGRVTVARLSQSGGTYRLAIGTGEMLRAPLSFQGTSGVLRFDSPVGDVLDGIMGQGLEHHFCLTYGDHARALTALAEMLDLPVISL
jgi:L-fucose isomerase-like protein